MCVRRYCGHPFSVVSRIELEQQQATFILQSNIHSSVVRLAVVSSTVLVSRKELFSSISLRLDRAGCWFKFDYEFHIRRSPTMMTFILSQHRHNFHDYESNRSLFLDRDLEFISRHTLLYARARALTLLPHPVAI